MTFRLRQGTVPLLVSIPHMGTEIPQDLRAHYVPRALEVEDTDWHLDRLYAFAHELGASVLQPVHSRYVIDLNRPPDDQPMYPGASNTELCPTRFFSGDPLHVDGAAPSPGQRLQRRAQYWQPYHDALRGELDRLKAQHGFVVLWDAHSIRSEIPWLFEGVLPDLNIGTANGASADASITDAVARAAQAGGVSHVVNGRFKGGYITRHYGRPAEHVHAVQLEMVQKTYMREEAPYDWDDAKAARIQPVVRGMVEAALEAALSLHGK
ncbi:N-formylglutamate deformylase [Ramlibacter algicola]|uniref:N-formylglutamate deformylase n=1 Tax=Ramlibacter algicola TaxID=2795217 RepID=A0A934Q287_9BURK|nr:N-formylglutamate deformylase [Ramlibacter algicola]MBK0394805.1 N-formylglutamate deformylase [Ramlibacter algicola]